MPDVYSKEEIDKILNEPQEEGEVKIFETESERVIARRMLPLIADKANKAADARAAKDTEKVITELRAWNEKTMQDRLDEITKRNQPPTQEEMEKLVSQEYLEFKVTVGRSSKSRDFVITELPQSVESKFMRVIQKKLLPHLQKFSGMEWTSGSTIDKLQNMVEIVPEVMELLAEACRIALDPRSEDPELTLAWVQDNLSSFRIMSIVECQMQAGRFRDFFSAVARNIPS
jgi:hypothetical protein